MRYFMTLAVLAAGLTLNSSVQAKDDDLFSEVAMEFVYASGNETEEADEKELDTVLPKRVTGSSTLVEMLTAAGFAASKGEGGVLVKLQHAGWKLQASMKTDVEQDRLTIAMPLAKIADESKVDQSKLLRLLTLGNREGDVFFAYDRASGMIELRRVMANRSLTSQRLQQELTEMATVAEAYEDAWSALGNTTKTTQKPAQNAEPKPAPRPTPKPRPQSVQKSQSSPKTQSAPKLSLVGTWSATLGAGEAFAIQINQNSTFQLVHVKSGKSVASTGKASRSGNQLTLKGDDGTNIIGTVTQTTANAFQLSLGSAKLNFKKAG